MASLVPQEVAHPGLQGLTSLVGGVASGCQGQRHRCHANPKYCSIIIIAACYHKSYENDMEVLQL